MEVKTEAGSKGNRSYKISFAKVEKVSDSCPTICLRKQLGRDLLRHGSSARSFLDRVTGVNVTVPESMHKYPNIFTATNSETRETEARFYHWGM